MKEKVHFLGLNSISFRENGTKTNTLATDIKALLFFSIPLAGCVCKHLILKEALIRLRCACRRGRRRHLHPHSFSYPAALTFNSARLLTPLYFPCCLFFTTATQQKPLPSARGGLLIGMLSARHIKHVGINNGPFLILLMTQ